MKGNLITIFLEGEAEGVKHGPYPITYGNGRLVYNQIYQSRFIKRAIQSD
jgi:hypothetical protein